MRVLLVNTTCKVGGVSTFLLALRGELLSKGHECDLFFFERGSMEAHLPEGGRAHFGTLADLMALVADRRIDVVHANNIDWPTGISAVRDLGARLVLTAHKVREPAWTHGWHAGNCDAFVAVSRWIAEALQPYTDAPIDVIHNGVDINRFHPAALPHTAPPIVAWVGRGSAARKRLEAFAEMTPFLRRAGFRIWVIDSQGPQGFASRCPEPARTLSATAERWHGVPFDSMPHLYQEIAASGGCLVSTASMEGLPLTLLEAQASGCAVIAAAVQGVDECVDPDHGGVLYAIDTPPADVAATITRTLLDRTATGHRQRAASSHVANSFSLQRMADRYLGIYRTGPRRPEVARGTRRHSPIQDWRGYVEERLGVGYAQFDAARTLSDRGHYLPGAAALRASVRTAPTMYGHPKRLARAFGTAWRILFRALRTAPSGSRSRVSGTQAPHEKSATEVGNGVA